MESKRIHVKRTSVATVVSASSLLLSGQWSQTGHLDQNAWVGRKEDETREETGTDNPQIQLFSPHTRKNSLLDFSLIPQLQTHTLMSGRGAKLATTEMKLLCAVTPQAPTPPSETESSAPFTPAKPHSVLRLSWSWAPTCERNSGWVIRYLYLHPTSPKPSDKR